MSEPNTVSGSITGLIDTDTVTITGSHVTGGDLTMHPGTWHTTTSSPVITTTGHTHVIYDSLSGGYTNTRSPVINIPPHEWDAEHNAYEHEHDMVYRVGNEHVTKKTQPFCLVCKRTMPQIVAGELKAKRLDLELKRGT